MGGGHRRGLCFMGRMPMPRSSLPLHFKNVHGHPAHGPRGSSADTPASGRWTLPGSVLPGQDAHATLQPAPGGQCMLTGSRALAESLSQTLPNPGLVVSIETTIILIVYCYDTGTTVCPCVVGYWPMYNHIIHDLLARTLEAWKARYCLESGPSFGVIRPNLPIMSVVAIQTVEFWPEVVKWQGLMVGEHRHSPGREHRWSSWPRRGVGRMLR
jgi:hypothetical protein